MNAGGQEWIGKPSNNMSSCEQTLCIFYLTDFEFSLEIFLIIVVADCEQRGQRFCGEQREVLSTASEALIF